jgi:hypothetical protein
MIRLLHDGNHPEFDPCGKWTMDEQTRMSLQNDTPDTELAADLKEEVLIGRLIDGEAKPADERQFEQLASASPTLWRTLAMRQRDMQLLGSQVDQEIRGADHVELHGMSILPHRLTWTLAMSGWAAMLVLALTWTAVVMYGNYRDQSFDPVRDGEVDAIPPSKSLADLTPQELLELYKANADWSVLELQSELLMMNTLENGDLMIRSMRRFDEEIIVPAVIAEKLLKMQEQGEDIPVDPVELEQLLLRLGGELKKPNREES